MAFSTCLKAAAGSHFQLSSNVNGGDSPTFSSVLASDARKHNAIYMAVGSTRRSSKEVYGLCQVDVNLRDGQTCSSVLPRRYGKDDENRVGAFLNL